MSKEPTDKPNSKIEDKVLTPTQKKMCGVIMPIANTSGYELGHWKDVLNIIEDALKDSDFEAKLVSERIDIGLIHEQIVTNIYENEIVICDVSSKNPNVMFELGMRLAFDKPTIIIKDEKTDYSFDIGGILHLEYPSSLRHNRIETFKNDLKKHVIASYDKAKSEKDYSPFLKSFAKRIIPKTIIQQEVTENQFILDKLDWIVSKMQINEKSELRSNLVQTVEPSKRYLKINDKFINSHVMSIFQKQYSKSELELALDGDDYLLTRMKEQVELNNGVILSKEDIKGIIAYITK